MRRSSDTLYRRVHEHVRLEAEHDVAALYQLVDPVIRARREQRRDDEPGRALAAIGAFCDSVRSAEIEAVEVLEARKVCERHGGRPAARVRSVVRYNAAARPAERETIWVQDAGVWYATSLPGRG